MSERSLLLDTCALIWLSAGASELSDSSRMAIDRADTVWVSAISAWEISLLVSKQKLILPDTSKSWFEKVLDQHRLSLAGLSVDVLVSANELPWHHRDPADRFIIATAQATGASVVTTDRKFELYDVPVVR